MEETGVVRFPGNLDPRAQEFRPRNPYNSNSNNNHLTLLQPQIYYPYPCVPYSFATPPPAYAPPAGINPPPTPPPLPPPSTTPSRTLLLSSVPTEVSESTVRRELEIFGDVRAVQMERLIDGILTVHFYDLRQAQAAAMEIREQHMQQQSRLRQHFDSLLTQNWAYGARNLVPPAPAPAPGLIAGRAVWAQFMIPAMDSVPDGNNQGTLVIFNLDSDVSTGNLREVFQAFGPVKELRDTPLKRHQRFVEFYDVRDAAKALSEMNGKEINGKNVVIEFSRPGGHSKRFSKYKFHSTPNLYARNLGYLSPPPPPPLTPPLTRKFSGQSPTSVPPRCYNYNYNSTTLLRKLSLGKGKPNGNNWAAAQGSTMGSQCIDGGTVGNGSEQSNSSSNRTTKKNTKKSQNTNIMNQQQQHINKSKQWKGGRLGKNYDPRFLINEDAIVESNCRDSRTTVMIKNIPNKYSQKLLLNMLDNHCIHCNEQIADGDDQPLSSYDFVYLPIDFTNKCNVGYGFVNMTSPQATLRLYKAFHLQNWEVFNSRKICEVTYARLQGLEALKEHFKNSKFPCEAEEYMPVVFTPPRDGLLLTEPTTIVGRAALSSPPSAAVSSKDSEADHDVMDGGDTPQEAEEDHDDYDVLINGVSHSNDDDDDDEDVVSPPIQTAAIVENDGRVPSRRVNL